MPFHLLSLSSEQVELDFEQSARLNQIYHDSITNTKIVQLFKVYFLSADMSLDADLRLCALGQIGLPKSVGVWGLYSFQSFRVTKMAEMYDVSSRNFLVFAPMNSTILAYM